VSTTDDDSSGTESDDLDMAKVSRGKRGGGAGGGGSGSDDDDDGGSDDGDDDDDDDGDDASVVQVDFEFQPPSEIDYKSIRRLLGRYLPGEEAAWDAGGAADAVIAQTAVGTVIKVEGDLDAYAFATVLPVSRHIDAPWMKDVKSFVLRKAAAAAAAAAAGGGGGGAGAAKAALDAAWASPASLGLLLNERVVNMPPELAPPLHDALAKDLATPAAAAAAGVSAVTHVLLIAPCWLERATPEAVAAHAAHTAEVQAVAARIMGGSKKKAGGGAGAGGGGGGGGGGAAGGGGGGGAGGGAPDAIVHYYHFEEELLAAEADAAVMFHVAVDDPVAAAAAAAAGAGGAGGGAAGKKRKASDGDGDGGAGGNDGDGDARRSLRVPQARRILLVPVAALPRAVAAMKAMLATAQAEAGAAAAAVAAEAVGAGGAGAAAPGARAGGARLAQVGGGKQRR
jgi:hypothetical protein